MQSKPKLRKKLRTKLQKVNITQEELVLTQPIWVRIFHWGFAFSLTGIILTGFELHKPARFLALNFGMIYIAHMTFTWLALGFVAFRLADALVRHDKSLIPKARDFKGFFKLLSYYFFRRSSPPPSEKYNSGQKFMFFSWFFLFIIASILGFASYWQGENGTWIIVRAVNGPQMIRWIKFMVAIYFTATIPLHIYLSITEDLSKLQAMVTGYERKSPQS